MDDIFFTESSEAPVPPEEVRIRNLQAIPRPDGQRINVEIEITPFQRKPNVELMILNAEGQDLSSLNVVEAIDFKMDFTMHIRGSRKPGEYVLKARVFYAAIEEQEAAEGEEVASGELLKKASKDVDSRSVDFKIE